MDEVVSQILDEIREKIRDIEVNAWDLIENSEPEINRDANNILIRIDEIKRKLEWIERIL
jgi:vacuolar-type H+-ATPase subunit E/Vma4